VQDGVTMWCMGWGMCKTWDLGSTHVCGRVKTCANGDFSMHSTCAPQVALLRCGAIQSRKDFFDMPKGDDIQMVYNGTSSGLNDTGFAPSFYLPPMETAGHLVTHLSSFCVHLDLGDLREVLLNFRWISSCSHICRGQPNMAHSPV
jgi:hypothetical protein